MLKKRWLKGDIKSEKNDVIIFECINCKFGFNVEDKIDVQRNEWFCPLCKIKQIEFHINRLKERLHLVANEF